MQLRHGTSLIAALMLTSAASVETPDKLNVKAPELVRRAADEWINSKPLQLAELRGRLLSASAPQKAQSRLVGTSATLLSELSGPRNQYFQSPANQSCLHSVNLRKSFCPRISRGAPL